MKHKYINNINLDSEEIQRQVKSVEEFVSVLSDCIPVVKGVKGVTKALDSAGKMYGLLKLESALKSFTKAIGEESMHEASKRLSETLKDKHSLKLVTLKFVDLVNKSNSIAAAELLGLYLGKILVDESLIESQLTVIIMDGLTELNDFDVNNFVHFFEFMEQNNRENSNALKIYVKDDETKYERARKEEAMEIELFISSLDKFAKVNFAVRMDVLNGTAYNSNMLSLEVYELVQLHKKLAEHSVM